MRRLSTLLLSEVLAEESILCLQKALMNLREIWEVIGIPEDQRLQRTEVVKKHIKVGVAFASPLRQRVGVPLRQHGLFLVSMSLLTNWTLLGFWCYLLVWVFFPHWPQTFTGPSSLL